MVSGKLTRVGNQVAEPAGTLRGTDSRPGMRTGRRGGPAAAREDLFSIDRFLGKATSGLGERTGWTHTALVGDLTDAPVTTIDAAFEQFDEAPDRGLFYASSRLTVLDHFRVPYEFDPELDGGEFEQLRLSDGGPALFWKRDLDGPVVAATLLGADRVAPIPVFTGS